MSAAFNITLDVKKAFFDRQKIEKAIGRANAKAMGDALRAIRQEARQSLLRRKTKPSPPNGPPYTRTTGQMNLKFILYYYDKATQTGVVGPIKFNGKTLDGAGRALSNTLPAFMEFGGSANTAEYQWLDTNTNVINKRFQRYDQLKKSSRKSSRAINKRVRRVVYKPKPFMGPALQKTNDEGLILDAWKYISLG